MDESLHANVGSWLRDQAAERPDRIAVEVDGGAALSYAKLLAVRDDEGYVTLVGRRKEMYISGGENVYPAEVEHVLRDHPEVSDVAVVGVPDAEWGETGRAYVVPHTEHFDGDALLAFARERLAGYKCPREVRLVAELPHTPSGKIQKHLLGP